MLLIVFLCNLRLTFFSIHSAFTIAYYSNCSTIGLNYAFKSLKHAVRLDRNYSDSPNPGG